MLAEEFARAGVPAGAPHDTFGIKMVGNTLLRWGTEEQKRHFLPRSSRGEDAGARATPSRTPAPTSPRSAPAPTLDGDEWVIDGQKIWTSLAHAGATGSSCSPAPTRRARAPRHLVPARARWTSPASRCARSGCSPASASSTRCSSTGARTPADNVVGEVDGGWAVAHDACSATSAARKPRPTRSCSAPSSTGCVALARDYGRSDDPLVRERLAWCFTKVETMRLPRLPHPHAVPPRRRARTRRLDLQALLERVPPACLGPGDATSWARRGLVPTGPPAVRDVRTDDPGAPNSTARGPTCSCSTRGRARSTRARRRSSATSSGRPCSACRRSPRAEPVQ